MEEIDKEVIFQSPNPNNKNILLLKSEADEITDICLEEGFTVHKTGNTENAISLTKKTNFRIIIAALGLLPDFSDHFKPLLDHITSTPFPHAFFIIYSYTACKSPKTRFNLFTQKANMVTSCPSSLKHVLHLLNTIDSEKGSLKCPVCKEPNLSEDGLWHHMPLYHVNDKNIITKCPVCKKDSHPNLICHYRNYHGLCAKGLVHNEYADKPKELHAFALVVCKRDDGRFLLVQEFAGVGYWLPGGRVDGDESLSQAAVRETKEEAGIDVELKGILTVQFSHGHGRFRIIYYAEPKDQEKKPKSIPDFESVGACYVTYEQIKQIKLRAPEPLKWIPHLVEGGEIYPLSVFSKE